MFPWLDNVNFQKKIQCVTFLCTSDDVINFGGVKKKKKKTHIWEMHCCATE